MSEQEWELFVLAFDVGFEFMRDLADPEPRWASREEALDWLRDEIQNRRELSAGSGRPASGATPVEVYRNMRESLAAANPCNCPEHSAGGGAGAAHDCATCHDCASVHGPDGPTECCGCYDGACCQEPSAGGGAGAAQTTTTPGHEFTPGTSPRMSGALDVCGHPFCGLPADDPIHQTTTPADHVPYCPDCDLGAGHTGPHMTFPHDGKVSDTPLSAGRDETPEKLAGGVADHVGIFDGPPLGQAGDG